MGIWVEGSPQGSGDGHNPVIRWERLGALRRGLSVSARNTQENAAPQKARGRGAGVGGREGLLARQLRLEQRGSMTVWGQSTAEQEPNARAAAPCHGTGDHGATRRARQGHGVTEQRLGRGSLNLLQSDNQ